MSPRRVLRNRLISRSRGPEALRRFVDVVYRGPSLRLRSRRRAHPRHARSRRAGLRRGRAGADALPRPGGVRLRHARRAAGPHRRHARDGAAALRGPAPRARRRSSSPCPAARGSRPSRRRRRSRSRLDPALRRYRLAMLDQRGTGKSGVLSCPNLQRLRALDAFKPQALANCANRIGPRRAFYTTADTVLDIDALRQALGADKIALYGHLVRHARRAAVRARLPRARRPAHPRLDRRPRRPRRLPARHLPQPAARARRAVRERRVPQRDQGPGGRRRRARAAHQRQRPAARPLLRRERASGGRRSTPRPDELLFLLIAGDLNPFLQASLPAAISAARRGDTGAAHAPAAHRPGRPDSRRRTCLPASTSPPAAPT